MIPDQLASLLQYRLQQAHETLREAEILFEASALRGVVNRAYYSMFYALLGLLATRELGTSKHSGALALFDREFVKAGLFPKDLSRSSRLAFNRRQTHDYGEVIEVDGETAREALADAKTFVTAVETYLKTAVDLSGQE